MPETSPTAPVAPAPEPSARPAQAPEPSARPAPAPEPSARPGRRVHLGLLVAQLCFGGFHVVGKAVLADLPPLALAAIRVGCAAPLMAVFAWRHDRLLPARRDLPMLALLGMLGVCGNQVLFVLGLQRTTAINCSILMPTMPVFAVLAGAAFGIERIGARRLVGVALSVAGALVLANPVHLLTGTGLGRALGLGPGGGGPGAAAAGASGGAPASVALGNAMLIGNCICWACFLVLQRPILRRLPWRTVIAWSFVLGAVPTMVLAWPQLAALRFRAVPPLDWLGMVYIVLFATVVAYAISTWAVRRSSPALVAAYSTLQPVVATALAATFLGERLGWTEGTGFALIAAGLWRLSAGDPSTPSTAAPRA